MKRVRSMVVVASATLALIGAGCAAVERVSLTHLGQQANGWSNTPVLSGDGRYVAFQSGASNLVEGDTNDAADVFVRDRLGHTTTLVSVGAGGTPANSSSHVEAISGDGHRVVFSSFATNLLPGDPDPATLGQLFVRDVVDGTTSIVSVSTTGAVGTGAVSWAAISAEGDDIVFRSDAPNLVADDTNEIDDVFVRDLTAGTTTRVSVASDGSESTATQPWDTGTVAITDDGSLVAFASSMTALVPGDTNGVPDVFVHDMATATTTRVSVDANDSQSNGESQAPALSSDGRLLAFASNGSNLVEGDTNGDSDEFLKDLQTGAVQQVSMSSTGARGNRYSGTRPSISGDGRYVSFSSDATNLVDNDTNGRTDLFVRDVVRGRTWRVDVGGAGAQSPDGAGYQTVALSRDGRFVAYSSYDPRLVGGDTNEVDDVFLRANQIPTIVGASPSALPAGTPTPVTLTGTYFAPGSSVSSGDGVAVGEVTVVDEQTITATLTPDPGAVPGARNLVVTLPNGGVGICPSCLAVT